MVELSDIFQAHTEGRFSKQRAEDATFNTPLGKNLNFCRIVVIDVIYDPTKLTDEYKAYLQHDLGVSNIKYINVIPRNTVIGQKLLVDSNESEPSMLFLPFMPSHLALPCKPGEHMWVFFESSDAKTVDIGYWMWRAVGFNHTDDVNHSHAPRDFDIDYYKSDSSQSLASGNVKPTYDLFNGIGNTDVDGKRYATANSKCIQGDNDAYEKILKESNASQLITYEAVPRYKKRPDEISLEGTNNTLIVLGTDRVDVVAEEIDDENFGKIAKKPTKEIKGKNTGKIDLVVGRGQTTSTSGKTVKNTLDREELGKSPDELSENEGDIDYKNDRSRILVAGKTLVDTNFNLNSFNEVFLQDESVDGKILDRGSTEKTLESDKSGDGAIVLKSDKVRLIARSDLIFYVTSFERDAQGNMSESSDVDKWACLAIKANGDVVIKPGKTGAILLGGEDADKGVMGSDLPCKLDRNTGKVSGPSPVTTMGGSLCTNVSGQAMFLNRILVKS